MGQPRFTDVLKAALSAPKGPGRKKLIRTIRARKENWDEERRVEMMRSRDQGYLVVPQSSRVTVHLNRNKPPMFSVKHPKKGVLGQGGLGGKTIGHISACLLMQSEFYVGLTGSLKTAVGRGTREPYAGVTGNIDAFKTSGSPEGTFGDIPKGGTPVLFDPRTYPAMTSLFFCVNGKPVSHASSVVMNKWKVYANGVQAMSQALVDKRLHDLIDGGASELNKTASFMRRRVAFQASYGDDPLFNLMRPDLIKIALQHTDLRPALLPLLK